MHMIIKPPFRFFPLFSDEATALNMTETSNETHAMKLPVHSFCADVDATGGLEMYTVCSAAELLWLITVSILQ